MYKPVSIVTFLFEPALTPGMGRTDSNGVSPPGRHLEQLDKAEIQYVYNAIVFVGYV